MDNEQSNTGPDHARKRGSPQLQELGISIPATSSASTSHAGHIPEASDPADTYRPEAEEPSSSDWEMDDMHSDERLTDDEETGLTEGDKSKRKQRKRRNTRLDERVATEDLIKKEENKLARRHVIQETVINGLLIALWYLFSISISVYNKWMFSKDNLDFHFPLFTTCVHMLVQFTLASLVLYFSPSLRPSHGSVTPHHPEYTQVGQSSQETSHTPPKSSVMTKWFYFTRIGPCGAATGLDIGLGNTSLKFITLTFFTMCKSSVLAFVLLFAFLFRLEKPSWKLGGIILLMSVGVIMMVAGETAFNTVGFILIMTSAFFSGFRWSLTHILLLRNPATSNPFSSIFFLAPVMFISLLVIALPVEGPSALGAGFAILAEAKGTFLAIIILLFPGVLAFLMTASEFALLKRTSVVTLSVCGIFKEVLTISAAALVFHDPLTPINISGLLVTIASIAIYNYIKIKKMQASAKKEAHEQVIAETPVLATAGRKSSVAGFDDNLFRHSTSELIRNSLSMQVDAPGDKHWAKGVDGDRDRASPVKRPEDLE